MKIIPLPSETVALTGFTHKVNVKYTDLNTTAGLTKTLQILPETGSTGLPIGTTVMRAATRVVTAFAGCATLGVEIGDDGDVDRNLVSSDMKATANTYKVSSVPTLGNTDNEIGGLTIGGTYSQSEVTALRDKAEELADDVRAIRMAIAGLPSVFNTANAIDALFTATTNNLDALTAGEVDIFLCVVNLQNLSSLAQPA